MPKKLFLLQICRRCRKSRKLQGDGETYSPWEEAPLPKGWQGETAEYVDCDSCTAPEQKALRRKKDSAPRV